MPSSQQDQLFDPPDEWRSSVTPFARPDEILLAGRASSRGGGQSSVILVAPSGTTASALQKGLAGRKSDETSLPASSVAFPLRITGSGAVALERAPVAAIHAIDDLSVCQYLLALPIKSMPHDVNEEVISSYRDTWFGVMQKWMSLQIREPEVDMYQWVFREMLTETYLTQSAQESAAETFRRAVGELKATSGTISLIPKDEFLKKVWEIGAASMPAGTQLSAIRMMQLSKMTDALYKVNPSLDLLQNASLLMEGLVFVFAPCAAVEVNCNALESTLPLLNGTMRTGAERALAEVRGANKEWLSRSTNWWRVQARGDMLSSGASTMLKVLEKSMATGHMQEFVAQYAGNIGVAASSAALTVVLGVYVSWGAASALNNLGAIISEMDKAYYASRIQEVYKSKVISSRSGLLRAISAGRFPDGATLNESRNAVCLYMNAGIQGCRHIAGAFNAQDHGIMDKLRKAVQGADGLTRQYEQEANDARDYVVGWIAPANVSLLYRNYLRRLAQGTGQVSNVPPSTTILVVDCSGSMSANTPDGKQKLEAAKEAARHYLDLIDFDAAQLGADHEVGLVAFSAGVAVTLPPTPNIGSASQTLDNLAPMSQTNFGDALDTAISLIEQLPSERSAGRKMIIFLSDGMTNVGPVARDEFLLSANRTPIQTPDDFANPLHLYQRAAKNGISIYTVGFGNATNPGMLFLAGDAGLDEDVLRTVSRVNGGEYYAADDAFKLDEVYVRSFHQSTGSIIFETTGAVGNGERKQIGPIPVTPSITGMPGTPSTHFVLPFESTAYADSPASGQMLITLGWSVGTLGLELVDPKGRVVDETYPGVHLRQDKQPICVAIDQPITGEWKATVSGTSVPAGDARYHMIASARVPPVSSGVGGFAGGGREMDKIAAVLVGVVVVGVLGAGVIVRRRRFGSHVSPAVHGWLQIHEPMAEPRNEPITRTHMTFGRDSGNDIVIEDPLVSSGHGSIDLAHDGVLLSDLGSTNGTRVGEEPITTATIRHGEHFHIGDTIIYYFGSES